MARKQLSSQDQNSLPLINVPAPTDAGDAANKQYVDNSTNSALDRSNHTGTQPVSSITGLSDVATSGDYNDLTVKATKSDVGLGNVDNTSDATKPISADQQAALDQKVDDDDSRLSDTRVPTDNSVTDAKIASDADISISKLELDPTLRSNHAGTQSADTITDGTTNHVFTAADDTKLAGIATGATANSSDATLLSRTNHTGTQSADTITNGTTNKVYTATEQTKLSGIATGATANETDANLRDRSTHTGTQTASTISDFIVTTNTAADARIALQKGATSGIATLDGTGKVPSAQLPAGIDEVNDDYATFAALPGTGQSSVIYVTTSDNKQYRWTGSQYIEIVSSPGSTDSISEGSTNLYFTTGRASAAAPVQSVSGMTGAVTLTKSNVGLSNVDNTSDASKPISTATQTALDAKEPTIPTGTTSQYIRGDKSLATLDKTAVGLSNIDNTSDTNKPVSTAQQTAIDVALDDAIALSIALGA